MLDLQPKTLLKKGGTIFIYLLSVHVMALSLFFLFRLIFFFANDYEFPLTIQHEYLLQSRSFLYGLWFDNVIACYVLLPPLAVLWISALLNWLPRALFRATAIFFSIFYGLASFVAAANIPYFAYFFKVINSSIFNWFEYGTTTAGMVLEESSYYPYLLLAVVATVLWSWSMWKLANWAYQRCKNMSSATTMDWTSRGIIFFSGAACIGLCIFGIRGRCGYNPIKVSQAFYCEDPFLNQVGINPVFNLLNSTIDEHRDGHQWLQLAVETKAVKNVQHLLQRPGITDISPIAQQVDNPQKGEKKNVIIVLMESMSAHLMDSFGADKGLTPHLDSIYNQSLHFSNCYSSGIHTNHGMYSTLYSFPAIMKRNAMKDSSIRRYAGLPTVLKEHGYRNLFFMTHESQYDNMNGFFRTNGFDEIYSQEDYPADKIANHFGVQDDYLFQYSLPVLRQKADSDQPFFAVLLTISNHPPYVIPPYFRPRSCKKEEQIVEYADWSIGNFMQQASREPWFENTIFVFLGDHGKLVTTPECELPESYNHIPLMFFGKGIAPELRTDFCGQVDVAPTLLHLLGIDYVQNNLGVDLLREKRPCIFYTADDWVAARDSLHLYIYNPETNIERCFHTDSLCRPGQPSDSAFVRLKSYAFSMLQTAEYLVKHEFILDRPKTKGPAQHP